MIKLIVAYDQNRAIGANNTIPWFIKGELKWVADTTKFVDDEEKINALIMGKNTWLSLPENRRPLPNRINIIVSTSLEIEDKSVIVFKSLEDAIKYVTEAEHIESGFIFGGASIYEQSLDKGYVDQVLTTEVTTDGNYTADTFFPELPESFIGGNAEVTTYGEDSVTRIIYTNAEVS